MQFPSVNGEKESLCQSMILRLPLDSVSQLLIITEIKLQNVAKNWHITWPINENGYLPFSSFSGHRRQPDLRDKYAIIVLSITLYHSTGSDTVLPPDLSYASYNLLPCWK
jgi:hypothetical protein